MKLRLPWQKEAPVATTDATTTAPCSHPRVEVEMHGTAIKRRWCGVCGQDLPVAERPTEE
jgi:D-arabinose 1-dehydrogenase-like Zn-dependent alcohol dehydrogenase